MIRLSKALQAWDTSSFAEILKLELEGIDGKLLPLQQGLSNSSCANEDDFTIIVLETSTETVSLCVKVGILYTGQTLGCNCADDPSPANETNEYCEVQFDINRETAETSVTLLSS